MALTQTAAARLLRVLPTTVADGLTGAEFRAIETHFGFTFNPDHRTLLAAGMPGGDSRWPNWRGSDNDLRQRLAAPIEGVLFDVEENDFWLHSWGIRPRTTATAVEVARRALALAPTLVPVFGHRYAPALAKPGLPVFSVMQTDVVLYGYDLADYFFQEFSVGSPAEHDKVIRVPFWSDLAG